MAEPRELPMFPLGTTVLPGTVLPLHIFEPRYVQLLLDVQAADGCFGTVLITRGREAGTDHDQQRANLGSLVRIAQAERIPEGGLRFAVLGLAEERIRVTQWLEDDPYPRAMITPIEEPEAVPTDRPLLGEALALLADVLNVREELGEEVGDPIDRIADDPGTAAFQIAALGGIGALDALGLLAADDIATRLDRTTAALRETLEALRFRLGS